MQHVHKRKSSNRLDIITPKVSYLNSIEIYPLNEPIRIQLQKNKNKHLFIHYTVFLENGSAQSDKRTRDRRQQIKKIRILISGNDDLDPFQHKGVLNATIDYARMTERFE